MPPPSPELTNLGELQTAVLNALWTLARPATVHEVLAALETGRAPAYTTVLTVIRSLERRGLVAHEQRAGERRFRYRALITAQDARDDVLHDVLNRLFAGSPARLIHRLLESEGFTLDELRALRAAVESREQAVTSGPGAASGSVASPPPPTSA